MSKINAGEVSITLDGEERTLKCTLDAATKINARFGDLPAAINRVSAMDLDATTFVIAAGLSVKDDKAYKALAQQVYAAGVFNLCIPTAKFVGNLARGGRSIEEALDDAGEALAAA